jgi:hypothetical protein
MNRVPGSIAFVAALLLGAHALADDSMTHADMTKRQLMNDCIQKQKAADVTMSKAQMKRFCKDQLKQQKASGAFPDPPAADTPRN